MSFRLPPDSSVPRGSSPEGPWGAQKKSSNPKELDTARILKRKQAKRNQKSRRSDKAQGGGYVGAKGLNARKTSKNAKSSKSLKVRIREQLEKITRDMGGFGRILAKLLGLRPASDTGGTKPVEPSRPSSRPPDRPPPDVPPSPSRPSSRPLPPTPVSPRVPTMPSAPPPAVPSRPPSGPPTSPPLRPLPPTPLQRGLKLGPEEKPFVDEFFLPQSRVIKNLQAFLKEAMTQEVLGPEGRLLAEDEKKHLADKVINPQGVCFGLSMLYGYFEQKGCGDAFKAELEKISNWVPGQGDLVGSYVDSKGVEHKGPSPIALAFQSMADNISLIQSPSHHKELFGKKMSQLKDSATASRLAFSGAADEHGNQVSVIKSLNFVANMDKESYVSLLEETLIHESDIYVLASNCHATSVALKRDEDGSRYYAYYDPNIGITNYYSIQDLVDYGASDSLVQRTGGGKISDPWDDSGKAVLGANFKIQAYSTYVRTAEIEQKIDKLEKKGEARTPEETQQLANLQEEQQLFEEMSLQKKYPTPNELLNTMLSKQAKK